MSLVVILQDRKEQTSIFRLKIHSSQDRFCIHIEGMRNAKTNVRVACEHTLMDMGVDIQVRQCVPVEEQANSSLQALFHPALLGFSILKEAPPSPLSLG